MKRIQGTLEEVPKNVVLVPNVKEPNRSLTFVLFFYKLIYLVTHTM